MDRKDNVVTLSDLSWDEKYLIGHEKIDSEHMLFFDLMKSIERHFREGGDKKIISGLLDELRRYADFHFCSEENIMYEIGYSGLADQRTMHRNLLTDLDILINQYKEDDIAPPLIIGFLFNWFLGHSSVEDRKIQKFIEQTKANLA